MGTIAVGACKSDRKEGEVGDGNCLEMVLGAEDGSGKVGVTTERDIS